MVRICLLILVGFLIPQLCDAAPAERSQPTAAGQIQRLEDRIQTLEQAEDNEAESLSRRDVAAAEAAASAAGAMITLTIVQIVLGVIGALGLIYTLILSARSLNLTTRTTRAQLRPYLGIEKFEPIKDGDVVLEWTYRFALKNYGSTAAIKLSSASIFHVIEGFPDSIIFPEPGDSDFRPQADVLPQGATAITIGLNGHDAATKAALLEKRASLLVVILVRYEDCFGDRHEVRISDIRSGPGLRLSKHNMAFVRPHQSSSS